MRMPGRTGLELFIVCVSAVAWLTPARADVTAIVEQDPIALAAALVEGGAGGVTVEDAALISHENLDGASSGRFTVTDPIPTTYGLTTNGVILSTGNVLGYGTGTNSTSLNSTDFGVAATVDQEALLQPITGHTNHVDATLLDIVFGVDPGVSNISAVVVFGSEEFPGTFPVDGFGAFLNGSNIAVVAGNAIRSDHPAMAELTGTELNGVLAPGSNAVIVLSGSVTPGSTGNMLTFIIGEGIDGNGDSTVYLAALGAVEPGGVASNTVDVAVTKIATPDPVGVGSNLVYTVTAANLGTNDASGVTVVDELPSSVSFVSAVSSQANCSLVGTTVTCEVGALTNGTTAQIAITVTPSIAGLLTNAVTISATETDSDPANNADSIVTVVASDDGGGGNNANLTGSWEGTITTKCKGEPQKCKVKGRLTITNQRPIPAGSSFVKFYLSDDAFLSLGDTFLKQVATGKVKQGKDKRKTLSAKLAAGVDPTGKFIIAVIDEDNIVAETNETDNVVVFGPLE